MADVDDLGLLRELAHVSCRGGNGRHTDVLLRLTIELPVINGCTASKHLLVACDCCQRKSRQTTTTTSKQARVALDSSRVAVLLLLLLLLSQ